MKKANPQHTDRARRQKRIRAKISGTKEVPRLSIYRSNKFIYAQLIDDVKGNTLAQASDEGLKAKTKVLRATEAGKALAKVALAKKIEKVVFDRGGFTYAGRVKAFADGAREGGLKF